jgi:hypothetical protein
LDETPKRVLAKAAQPPPARYQFVIPTRKTRPIIVSELENPWRSTENLAPSPKATKKKQKTSALPVLPPPGPPINPFENMFFPEYDEEVLQVHEPPVPSESLHWLDKYAPVSFSDFVGNKKAVEEVCNWLENRKKPYGSGRGDTQKYMGAGIILSGPPGVGKTELVKLICRTRNLPLEMVDPLSKHVKAAEVSDDVMKKMVCKSPIDTVVCAMLSRDRTTVGLFGEQQGDFAILIDEADHISETQGAAFYNTLAEELVPYTLGDARKKLVKTATDMGVAETEDKSEPDKMFTPPIFLTVNNGRHESLKSLSRARKEKAEKPKYEYVPCTVVYFNPLWPNEIRNRLLAICKAENIYPEGLDIVTEKSRGDMRKAIVLLQECCRVLSPRRSMLLAEVRKVCEAICDDADHFIDFVGNKVKDVMNGTDDSNRTISNILDDLDGYEDISAAYVYGTLPNYIGTNYKNRKDVDPMTGRPDGSVLPFALAKAIDSFSYSDGTWGIREGHWDEVQTQCRMMMTVYRPSVCFRYKGEMGCIPKYGRDTMQMCFPASKTSSRGGPLGRLAARFGVPQSELSDVKTYVANFLKSVWTSEADLEHFCQQTLHDARLQAGKNDEECFELDRYDAAVQEAKMKEIESIEDEGVRKKALLKMREELEAIDFRQRWYEAEAYVHPAFAFLETYESVVRAREQARLDALRPGEQPVKPSRLASARDELAAILFASGIGKDAIEELFAVGDGRGRRTASAFAADAELADLLGGEVGRKNSGLGLLERVEACELNLFHVKKKKRTIASNTQ